MSKQTTIIHPRQSTAAFACGAILGLAILGLSLVIATDDDISFAASAIALVSGSVLAGAFTSLGQALGASRGGLFADDTTLHIGLTSPRNRWQVPLDEVRGVCNAPFSFTRDGEEISAWSVQLELYSKIPISLHETPDSMEAAEVTSRIANHGLVSKVAVAESKESNPAYENTHVALGVNRNWAMKWPLFLFGSSLLTLGTGILLIVRDDLVFALFFAPVLALLGAILVGLTFFKWLGREELHHRDEMWTHCYRLGPFRWGIKTVRAQTPQWRIKVHSLRGGSLELIGDSGILVLGSGATMLSRMSIKALATVPEQFATRLVTETPHDPPAQA